MKELFYPDGQTATRQGQGTLYLGSEETGKPVCRLQQCGSEVLAIPVERKSGRFYQERDKRKMYRSERADHHASAQPDRI